MVGLLRLRRGERFAHDFEVERVVAEGGMGTVYAVFDHAAGEARAIKLLAPELVADEKSRRRFTQEAQVASAIESPHVPQVFRGGIDPVTATPYIVMELLTGVDLRERVERDGALPRPEARWILEQLCHALGAAHRAGVVPRDLKPSNVFLQERTQGERTVKLLDFGVAKLIDAHRTSATGTGAVGSPMWMAPEQTSAGGRIAASTDVWALGLLAFFVLSGEVFWESAKSPAGITGLLREIHIDPVPRASERARSVAPGATLPDGFDDWFAACVHREHDARFTNATAAWAALRPMLERGDAHSELAYAETLAFESPVGRGDPTPLDVATTTPFDAPPAEQLEGRSIPTTFDSQDAGDRGIPDTHDFGHAPLGEQLRAAEHVSPAPRPEPSSEPRAATAAAPARRRQGMSPWLWGLILLVSGVAVSLLTAVIVWVALTVSTP